MKFAFCTCVQIGLSCIEAIYQVGGNLDLIITLPDNKSVNKSGRIYVDNFAKQHNIKVVKSPHVNDEIVANALKESNIDWLFIIGWSQIASKEIIDIPNNGAIGAHPTLLPIGRGRAAIPWAIIKGLDKTGVTFFKMDEGIDSGLILGQLEVLISQNETATTLYDKINYAHESLIKELYPKLVTNSYIATKQDEAKVTFWPGRKPEDGELHAYMNLDEVDRLVRATTKPYPGAYYKDGGKKIIIWSGLKGQTENAKLVLDFQDGKFSVLEYEIRSES
jgi:methionyl-tRNA formyltransferase